jgi:hypothetical protein
MNCRRTRISLIGRKKAMSQLRAAAGNFHRGVRWIQTRADDEHTRAADEEVFHLVSHAGGTHRMGAVA